MTAVTRESALAELKEARIAVAMAAARLRDALHQVEGVLSAEKQAVQTWPLPSGVTGTLVFRKAGDGRWTFHVGPYTADMLGVSMLMAATAAVEREMKP